MLYYFNVVQEDKRIAFCMSEMELDVGYAIPLDKELIIVQGDVPDSNEYLIKSKCFKKALELAIQLAGYSLEPYNITPLEYVSTEEFVYWFNS